MSATGHSRLTRSFDQLTVGSAAPPIAAVSSAKSNCRWVPKPAVSNRSKIAPAPYSITSSAREQRRRQLKAKGLGGVQVDDQLVFGRCLYRQVGWLLALEDAVYVAGRAAIQIGGVSPIRD